MAPQLDDILAALAQRRQADGDHVQTIEQILAELALADRLAQVAMGGGDDAHIGLDGNAAADGGELALLQHAQQPGLGIQWHVADLVQEQRSGGGLLEAPHAAGHRSGEGALLMAEELALDQLARDRRHVHGDEGSAPALAIVMQGAGRQLLAGARFAEDHHRQVGRHQPRHDPVDVLHGGRAADKRQGLGERCRIPGLRRLGAAESPLDQRNQLVEVEGLGQIVEGAALGGAHRRQQRVLGAHGDDAQIRAPLADAGNEVEAVAVGHDHIGDDEIAGPFADPLPQGCRLVGAAHLVAQPAQRLIQDDADRPIVVGDQNGSSVHDCSSSAAFGRRTRNCVRRGSLASSMSPP